jgi:hypothetical protein
MQSNPDQFDTGWRFNFDEMLRRNYSINLWETAPGLFNNFVKNCRPRNANQIG